LDKNIIGIDFSLNSPGICILNEDGMKWISIHRTKNSIPNMLKKAGTPFTVLGKKEFVTVNLIERETHEGEYHEKERSKIVSAVHFADLIFKEIEPYLNENTHIGMEGISFGSRGNSLIDISMATALLRERLIRVINPERLFVIAPTTIKKFAIKGNAKKDQLYDAIIEKGKEDMRVNKLSTILEKNKGLWVKKSGKVDDPCSDIIDATWICLYIENYLGNF
jgi:hypothetical protein